MSKKKDAVDIKRWQTHLQAWNKSGLSQAAYCKQHRLIYSQFGYWQRKLRSRSSGFTPVVQQTPVRREPLSIRLPSGIEIHGVDGNRLANHTCQLGHIPGHQ